LAKQLLIIYHKITNGFQVDQELLFTKTSIKLNTVCNNNNNYKNVIKMPSNCDER